MAIAQRDSHGPGHRRPLLHDADRVASGRRPDRAPRRTREVPTPGIAGNGVLVASGDGFVLAVTAVALPPAPPITMPSFPIGQPLPLLDGPPAVGPWSAERPAHLPLRRCVFRRITVAGATRSRRRIDPVYAVECLFAGPEAPADRVAPFALGDIASARTACDACTFPGRFRADED